MALTGYVQISPGNFAMLEDAGLSGYVASAPADDNGDWVMNPPPGSYTLYQGPTPQGPWTTTGTTVVVANADDAAGDLTPVGFVFPGNGAGQQQTAVGICAGTGAPNNAVGQNGYFYFRSDGGAGTSVYMKRAGAWVGIL